MEVAVFWRICSILILASFWIIYVIQPFNGYSLTPYRIISKLNLSTTRQFNVIPPVHLFPQHPVATRMCTHEERLRHLRKYCTGEGAAIAEKYRQEVLNRSFFSSTNVSAIKY